MADTETSSIPKTASNSSIVDEESVAIELGNPVSDSNHVGEYTRLEEDEFYIPSLEARILTQQDWEANFTMKVTTQAHQLLIQTHANVVIPSLHRNPLTRQLCWFGRTSWCQQELILPRFS